MGKNMMDEARCNTDEIVYRKVLRVIVFRFDIGLQMYILRVYMKLQNATPLN